MRNDQERLAHFGARMKIELPWPSPKLHPNKRLHWSVRAKEAKKARQAGYWATRSAEGRNLRIFDGVTRVPVVMTFHPPDRRRRDADGMMSSMKSSLDGISDCL